MTDLTPYNDNTALATPRSFTSERGVGIDELITAWLHEKASQSTKTHDAYKDTINDFRSLLQRAGYDLVWKDEKQDFLPMIADFAQAFASMRSFASKRTGPVTPATMSQRLSILSSFYLYLIKRQHILTGNPIDSVDRPHVEPFAHAHAMEQEEIAARLAAINVSTLRGARDLALLLVLLQTGRRVKEVAALTRGDIEIADKHLRLTFRHTKNNEEMRDTLPIPISRVLTTWLETFYKMPLKDIAKDSPVWVNIYHQIHYGKPLGYHGVAGVCKHYLGTSKVHTTRHTFAVLMELAGAKLTDIQQRLGHKNAATTSIYLQRLTQDRNVHGDKLAALLGFEEE